MATDPLDDVASAVMRPESWVSPELVSARKLNQQVAILRRLLTVMGWDENTFRGGDPKRLPFPLRLGMIETSGPSGQVDYPDERYWVREKVMVGAPSPWDLIDLQTMADFTVADPTQSGASVTIKPLYTVSNILEIPDHTHSLKEGTPVLFLGLHDAGTAGAPTPATRYVMAIGGGSSIRFGVMVGAWAADSNAVILTPCRGATDATPTGAANISAFIQFPTNAPAPAFGGNNGDILGYMSIGDGLFVLIAAPVLPRGTAKFQVLVNQAGPLSSDWRPDFVRARGA